MKLLFKTILFHAFIYHICHNTSRIPPMNLIPLMYIHLQYKRVFKLESTTLELNEPQRLKLQRVENQYST